MALVPVAPEDLRKKRAREILVYLNQVAAEINRHYKMAASLLWDVEGWTTQDADQCLREMDKLSAGASAKAFELHGRLGELIKAVAPEDFIEAPISYAVEVVDEAPAIKLDVAEEYPRAKKERLEKEARGE